MSTPIEIQGMTLSIDWYRDSNDNLIVKRVSNLGNSYEFLTDNLNHPALSKIATKHKELSSKANVVYNFYQLSHYEQYELICEMLNYDDSLHHYFADDCYIDKDTHFALKEDCY